MSNKKTRVRKKSGTPRRKLKPSLIFEELEKRALLAATNWTNPLLPMDVTQDRNQSVDPLDALVIINELNSPKYTTATNRRLPDLPASDREPRPYFDVDCDGFVSPLDVLTVINTINSGVIPIGWRFDSTALSSDGGFVSSASCGPRLHEGTSYLTEISREVVIPENATNLSFRVSDPFFDLFSPTGMKDAFEVALVDQNGKSLVLPFAQGRDAFLNMSEEQSTATAPGVQWIGDQVLVNVSQIPPNTTVRLIARLVNNDLDTQTSVAIRDVRVETQGDAVPVSSSVGISEPLSQVSVWEDMQGFADVTGSLVLRHGRTSHVDNSGVIYSEIAVDNAGNFSTQSTVRVVFKNFSDPSVRLRNPDGFTSEGDPYVDFSSAISSSRLNPGERSAYRRLGFFNPAGIQFAYEAEVYSKLNRSPEITSSPSLEALLGRPYSYQVDALDLDEDQLVYSLLMGPAGMQVDRLTGRVTWEANTETLGNHSVAIRVEDPFGGATLQSYVLTAMVPPPNRPPVITSTPKTSVKLRSDQASANIGRVVVSHDVNILSTSIAAESERRFAVNVARWLTESGGQRLLLIESNPYFEHTDYAPAVESALIAAGFDLTVVTYQELSSLGLSDFDAVFLAQGFPGGIALDNQHLLEYLQSGGGVYLAAGVWGGAGGPEEEANDWQVFMAGIGLRFATDVNNIYETPISSSHPIFEGITTLKSGNGQYIYDLNKEDNRGRLLVANELGGFFAIYGADTLPAVGITYEYQVTTIDADNDRIRYSLTRSPRRMMIDNNTGFMRWSPTTDQIGTHSVIVEVSDGRGGVATQSYSLRVLPNPENHPPLIVTDPVEQLPIATSPVTILEEDFSDSGLDPRIQFISSGTFLSEPGVKNIENVVGFGFGRSTNRANSFDSFTSTLRVSFAHPVYVSSLSFREREVYGNWGSQGRIYIDGVRLGDPSAVQEFGRIPVNDMQADEDFREQLFQLNRMVSTIDLQAWDITDLSELFIKDLKILGLSTSKYSYHVGAIDPDGDALRYELLQAPAGMTIDPQTGSINWDPNGSPRRARLYNSGVNVDGVPLSQGSVDPNWTIISGPGIAAPTPAIVTNQHFYANSLQSRWVWVNGSGNGGSNATYTFRQTIDLTGYDLSTVVITGGWGADNFGTIRLNEASPQGTGTFSLSGVSGSNFSQFHDFQIMGSFVPGINTLDFVITDVDGLGAFGVTGLTVNGSLLSDVPVTVRVFDDHGGFDDQSWTIDSKGGSGVIRGVKWDDVNQDGARDLENEPGLEGWTIYLDENNNGLLDANERSTKSDRDGRYVFEGLPSGSYRVREQRQSGWQQTYPGGQTDGDGRGYYVDWVSADVAAGKAQGVILLPGGSTVEVRLEAVFENGTEGDFLFAQTDGGGVDYWQPSLPYLSNEVSVRPPGTDIIALVGGQNQIYRVTLSEPIFEPIMSIVSLGSELRPISYAFDSPFSIVSQGPGYFGGGPNSLRIESNNVLYGNEGHGTIKFRGVFDGFSWTVPTPEDWHGFTFGIRSSEALAQDGFHMIELDADEVFVGADFGNTMVADQDNRNPEILSSAPTSARVGARFQYKPLVRDLDGDGMLFDLPVRPSGMVIDPSTGHIAWVPTQESVGKEEAILRVSDGHGGVDLQSFVIDVSAENSAPVVVSTPRGPATIDLPWQYQVVAQDPEGDQLEYSLNVSPTGMTIDPTLGVVRWIPGASDSPNQRVEIRVFDGLAETIHAFDLLIVASGINESPLILSSAPSTVVLGREYIYQLVTDDANGDPLSYFLTSGPAGVTVNTTTGLILWRPLSEQLGKNELVVRVEDGRGGVASQTFEVDVLSQPRNSRPTIISTPTSIAVRGLTYAYDAIASDPDSDLLTWSLVQGPPGLSIGEQNGSLRWIPSDNQIGEHRVEILVDDANGGQARQSFTILVEAANSPPIISSNPPTIAHVGSDWLYPIQATDRNGDDLTISVLGPADMMVDQSARTLSWTPSAALIGIHEITLLVSDGKLTTQQQFDLEVTSDAFNEPPRITSSPALLANVNADYVYQVTAVDADNDPINYSLSDAPAGMLIDAMTGLLTWRPTNDDVGLKQVRIIAGDPKGGRFMQTYGLRVLPPNQPPTIVSEPRLSVTRGAMYRYNVRVNDPDQQAILFELFSAPSGMTLDQQGRLQWNTSGFSNASANVGIRVSDGLGGIDEQNYTIQVNSDTTAPQVIVNATPQVASLGDDVIFALEDTDNIGVIERSLRIDGVVIPLDSSGRARVKMMRAGNIPIRAIARDAGGNEGQFEHSIQVMDPSDSDAPVAVLSSLTDNAIIRSMTDVVGTVSDSNFAYYSLSIATLEGEYREIARGTSSVTQSVLGTLDPSLLQNDNYRLRLEAFDTSGKSSYDERVISIAGDLKIGSFTLSFADLSVPVAGFPISVVRTYDTLTANESDDFGYGWRMEFRDTNLRTNVPKTGSEEDLIFNPFFAGARVFLQLPGGKREGFTFQPRPAPGLRGSFLGIFEPAFIPDRGVTSQLTVPNTSLSLSASGDVFAYGSGQPFHPASPLFGNSYLLTTAEGITYNIDGLSGDLRSVLDLNGNEITFNDNEIASSSGPKVQFERDVQGRIVSVTDPAGQKIRYTYDRLGDLTSVTDRAGNTTRFVYRSDRPHYLEKILDPLGREGIRTEYDEQGRLARTVDSLGNAVQQEYDLANSKLTVRDQLGNPTVFEYDDEGNVVAETNALGEVTRRSYDDAGNVLEEIDPLGQKTIRTYDRFGNVLTEKDPLGNTTYTVYGPNGQVLSSLDALGNATTNQYDSKGNLLRTIAPGGLQTAMSYDRSGNPTSITFGGGTMAMSYDSSGRVVEQTDALGSVTRFTYDVSGNQLTSTTRLTTPSGVRNLVTSMEYDANNRVIRTVDPEGGVTRVEYDAAGNKVADIDALGRRTEYRYDERGLLVETIYPDSTPNDPSDNPRTRTEYDAAGRPVARIDELGRKTVTKYDKIGRVVETIYPDSTPNDLSDNPRTRTEYDAAGRKAAEIDERGNRSEFEYDAAGRQTAVRDALGNVTRSTLDAAGRQIAVTDPLNRTTRFTHDASGRPVETNYADGSKTGSSFDANGRLIRRTDQMGRSTRYEHDALGRLTAVIDALGQRTEYTYDESGNLVAQKDANGNITRHEFDGLRRRVATQLPMGQRSTTEYDTVGNVVRTTDFNGDSIEYSYDPRNRLVTKTFPGGSTTEFSYTLIGQRDSSEDGRGRTQWDYDERGRLISRIDPDGQSIAYTYDVAGNRTSLTTTAGTIAYSFDALNRMTTVTDPNGGTTRYAYNPVSNLVRTELPNGTWETREYDTLNRLVYLENQSPSGVISSYRYTLTATGRRDAVEEQSGRTVAYQYDALDRLTQETITDAIFGNRSIDYSYDPVGNRLSRNDSVEGTTSYTYDDNDRLLTETLSGALTEYAYDANGNTLSKTNAVDRVFYEWDSENRLVGVDTDGDGTIDVTNVYDADGIRVSQILGTEETRYLIDTVQPYQQVALEYTPSGVIKVSYVHGLDLISQNRPSSSGLSYYHVDGLGSTRALSNASGIVTDRYIYDAFGRTIGQVGTTGNVYLFAGEQRDLVTGLDYLRARWMNPAAGRFVSRDRFEGFLEDPITTHRYIYSNSNPVNRLDPSGFASILASQMNTIAIRLSIGLGASALQFAGGVLAGGNSGLEKWDAATVFAKTELGPATGLGVLGLFAVTPQRGSIERFAIVNIVVLGGFSVSKSLGSSGLDLEVSAADLYVPGFFRSSQLWAGWSLSGMASLVSGGVGGTIRAQVSGTAGIGASYSVAVGSVGFAAANLSGVGAMISGARLSVGADWLTGLSTNISVVSSIKDPRLFTQIENGVKSLNSTLDF